MSEKRKVAIFTITSNNCGNRLQNYALQSVLQGMGFLVYTIPKKNIPSLVRSIAFRVKVMIGKDSNWNRFNKYINWNNFTVESNYEPKTEKFDYVVVGSDQVWNPNFPFVTDKYFLSFAKKEKRVAYAASIGISHFSDEQKEIFKNRFNMINKISVREESAAEIIKDCCPNCKTEVVLDPTLLLHRQDWEKIAAKSVYNCNQKYIFVYFLGKRSEKCKNYIKKVAKEKNAIIIDMQNLPKNISNKIGPFEFVSLISKAECMITDSFHCCVFSLLFHKQFVAFERDSFENNGDMSSRLKNLLAMFDFENRYVSKDDEIPQDISIEEYNTFDTVIKEKRIESLRFLADALNVSRKDIKSTNREFIDDIITSVGDKI